MMEDSLDKLSLRCSSLDRLFKCSHFVKYPNSSISTSEFASDGTELHNNAEQAIKGRCEPRREVFYYYEYAISKIKKSTLYGVESSFKTTFDNFVLTGSVDFWCYIDDTLYIVDLKTGTRRVYPFCYQLRGYELLVKKYLETLDIIPNQTKLKIFQFGREFTYTSQINDDLVREITHQLGKLNLPIMGGHCSWCNALVDCILVNKTVDRIIHEIF